MKFPVKTVLALALAGQAALASAQTYPDKPIRVLVSTVPGPLDAFARVVMEQVGKQMKQSVVIENRPGAGGNLAADMVARAKPDGYTLLFAIDTTFTVNPSLYRNLSFDPVKDFVPISLPVTYAQALVVNPTIPVNTVAEFVSYVKSHPTSYASGGNGSPSHLSMASFMSVAGLQMSHVPYKGTGASIIDVMAGQVNSLFAVESGVVPYSKAGKLRLLATSGDQRSVGSPQVPTIAESGYPGFNAEFAYVLMAPADTPPEVIKRLAKEVGDAMETAQVKEFDRANIYDATNLSQPQVAGWIEKSRKRWADVITKENITIE